MKESEDTGEPGANKSSPTDSGAASSGLNQSLAAVSLVSLSLVATSSSQSHSREHSPVATEVDVGVDPKKDAAKRVYPLLEEQLDETSVTPFYVFERLQPRIRLIQTADCSSCGFRPTVPPVTVPTPVRPVTPPPRPTYTPPAAPTVQQPTYRPPTVQQPTYRPPTHTPPSIPRPTYSQPSVPRATPPRGEQQRPTPTREPVRREAEPPKPQRSVSDRIVDEGIRDMRRSGFETIKEELWSRGENWVENKAREHYNNRIVDAGRTLWEAVKENGEGFMDRGKQLLKDLAADALSERFADGLDGQSREQFKEETRPFFDNVVNAFGEGRNTLKGRFETVQEQGTALKNFFNQKFEEFKQPFTNFKVDSL